jgi:hypothetical protein
MVLDPCLQFPVNWTPVELPHVQQPYVALYGHNFSEYFIRQIRAWADKQGLPLISVGYRNDWADEQWLTADPNEFANFIAGAQAVVTNFFHGCVFSLINAKPFVCETSDYRSIKVQGLMQVVGGEKHLVSAESPEAVYEARLSEPVDQAILDKIVELRQNADAFLDQALSAKRLELS